MAASTTQQLTRRLRKLAQDPKHAALLLREAVTAGRSKPAPPATTTVLSHGDALARNGFTVFRGLIPAAECTEIAAAFKAEAGIVEGTRFTRTDSMMKLPGTRRLLFDERVLGAVRSTLAEPVRFLQVSDLHYRHDTAAWHRDSVHRAKDSSDAPDWSDDQGRYGIVKAIVYLESENAAMGLLPGSHLSPKAADIDRVHVIERRHGQVVVDADDEPNREFSAAELNAPLAWRAFPGDVLVFDQRLYHCGRRVDDGKVTKEREAPKFTLSMVFGLDNMHSSRFYSYFRYARRELGFRTFADDFEDELRAHDLLLSTGQHNHYEQHPDEIRLAALRQQPEGVEELIEEFRQAGQQSG